MTWTNILTLIGLAVVSGVCGRLGGSAKDGNWYDFLKNTNTRDVGCSVILLVAIYVMFGFNADLWWAYLLTGVLTFGSFRTYWDRLFGYDCHWFSGLMVGVAATPLLLVDPIFYWIVPIRAIALAFLWHNIEKLPPNVWIWRQDVAVEFCRYAVSF